MISTITRVYLFVMMSAIFSGCNVERSFLYFPDVSRPSDELLKAHRLKAWRPSTTDYRGFVSANGTVRVRGTVIVFHGNAGRASDRVFYNEILSALGYRVVLAEYPAYGGRKGDLGEKSFVADAVETIRMVFEQFKGPIFLLGESLGCGVAAAAAARTHITITGIILVTPWDTLVSVAQSKFPYLPVRFFLADRYDNIGNLRDYKGNVAIIGAEKDEIIPLKHAENLYDSLSADKKRMWILKAAKHNNWPMYSHPSLWKEIMDFMKGMD